MHSYLEKDAISTSELVEIYNGLPLACLVYPILFGRSHYLLLHDKVCQDNDSGFEMFFTTADHRELEYPMA